MLDKVHSGINYSAIYHEFNVDKSIIYIKQCVLTKTHIKKNKKINKTHIKQGYMLIS